MQFGTERKPARLVLGGAPAVELGGHLVPPGGAAGAAGDRRHVVEAKRKEHGLLQPLVDMPGLGAGRVAEAFGDTERAGVEQAERLVDSRAHVALGFGGDRGTIAEGRLDDGGEGLVGGIVGHVGR